MARQSGEVVFAGYGLVAPGENGAPGYDSYAGLDVKDKIVLVLRYVPEGVEPARRAQLNRYASLRYKTMLARERGAKAVLVVTGPNSPNAGEVLALTNDAKQCGQRHPRGLDQRPGGERPAQVERKIVEGSCRPRSTRRIRTPPADSLCRRCT